VEEGAGNYSVRAKGRKNFKKMGIQLHHRTIIAEDDISHTI
jgi:hypothetical protein